MPRRWLLSVLLVACSPTNDPAPASAPARKVAIADGYDSQALGALTFEVSNGTPEARAHFARGLLALHSFWYDEASRQFEAAIASDSSMRMAYWGAAMSKCKLLWADDDVNGARQLLARLPDPDAMSPREQAWVSAAVELLRPTDVRTSRKAFAAAMENVYRAFPDDESATFLAAALLAAMAPEDPDQFLVRVRAAGLALDVYRRNPKHPGAAHYAIHAFDTPMFAPLALPLAEHYARTAPAAFHARHMPAHIFSRLGMWKEAIASCQAAWDASQAAARLYKLSADHYDFHSLNWLVEMHFELGHRKAADAALATFAQAVKEGVGHQIRAQFASQVLSYLMRTGEWSRADELLAPLSATPAKDSPSRSDVASHCAAASVGSPYALVEEQAVVATRARAAAMAGDLANTKQLLAHLDTLRVQLRPILQTTQSPEAIKKFERTHEWRRRTLLARATKNDRALLAVLRESIDGADSEVGGETIQTGFLAREELADTLLRLGDAKAAAAEYARTLATHPRRARSLLGAARAAAKLGDRKTARARYSELLLQWATADAETDGLTEAKAATAEPD